MLIQKSLPQLKTYGPLFHVLNKHNFYHSARNLSCSILPWGGCMAETKVWLRTGEKPSYGLVQPRTKALPMFKP